MSKQLNVSDRIKICINCEHLAPTKVCNLCNYYMPFKIRLKDTHCPIDKWGQCIEPVITNIENIPIVLGKPTDIQIS